jgi:hypothetical protein
MQMAELRTQIDRGEYQFDPRAVADAIVRRLSESRSCDLGRMRSSGVLVSSELDRGVGEHHTAGPIHHLAYPRQPRGWADSFIRR